MTVAFLVITYAEIYLIGLAGIIVLGFAGLQETRAASVAYIRLLIGKALKLMALMIVYGAVATLTTAMAADVSAGTGSALSMIMLQIITALLIISLPGTVEALVSNIGASSAEGGAKFAGNMAQGAMKIAAVVGITAAFQGFKNLGGNTPKTPGKQAVDTLKNAATPGSSPGSSGGDRMSATEALGGKAAADLQAKISKAIGGESGGGNGDGGKDGGNP